MNNLIKKDVQMNVQATGDIKFAYIRRTPQSLYADVEKWINSLGAKEIISHQQSESDGYLTLTVFYR